MDIRAGLLNGEKRAAARLISMLESGEEEAQDIIRSCYQNTGKARIIGITGPPGAGKSTVTDKLAKLLRKKGYTVGIIAVDPTSPFTGGAILGDRVRMADLNTDQGVFIRSMGTRGALGGLSKAAHGAVKVLDIFGMDYIFLETVGVGQSEVDIVRLADTVVMVMVPGLGDDIQAIKAGIMEIGDVFAVNKSDREGAERTAVEIEAMLDFNKNCAYRPDVVNITAKENINIDKLMESIEKHHEFMKSSGYFTERKKQSIRSELMDILRESIVQSITKIGQGTSTLEQVVSDIFDKKMDPYTASKLLMNQYRSVAR